MRRLGMAVGLLVAFALATVLAGLVAVGADAEWEELESGIQHRVSPWTGETEIAFYVKLEYVEPVHCPEIDFQWQVFSLEPGPRTLLAEYTRHQRFRSCVATVSGVSSHSDYIVPVPGQRYEATITVDDLKYGAHYERTISYTVPVGFPTGIGVYAEVDDEVVMGYDLGSLSDDELGDLVRILDALRGDYVQTASETAVGSFFREYVTPDTYPAEVIVLPALPQPVGESDTRGMLTVSYNRMLLTYPVPTAEAVSGVLSQIGEFEQEFVGDVLLFDGEPTDPIVPVAVFVHQDVWDVLEAARDELAERDD